MPDEDSPWYRQLLLSLAVMAAVAVVVVTALAVTGLVGARILGATAPSTSTSVPGYLPRSPDSPPAATRTTRSPHPGTTSSPTARPTAAPTTAATTRPTTAPTTAATTRPTTAPTSSTSNQAITLAANPQQVSTYERINLTGSYAAPDGTTLQVQRQEAGGTWLDFPTTTSVHGGTFATYIETGRTGTNRFRMLDSATGAASNVVIVTVG